MGEDIGRFNIRRELGRGSQSVVYLAWDPQLQREVAIKTLHFSKSDPQINTHLLSEARTVSNLRHANIVPIFDAGEENGDPYLVFEFVDGSNLDQLIRRDGALSPAVAVNILRNILAPLVQAHAQGIVHRDLKPSNILIDKDGMARVMDFGIAIRIENGRADLAADGLMGTPPYLAPEYVTKQIVSAQNDIYAAGLILIEMLSGRRVVQADSLAEMLAKVANEQVVLPAGARIDERLGDIALKACSLDPATRYSSVSQMMEQLDAYLFGNDGNGESGGASDSGEEKKKSTLEFLLRRMRHKSDFPALADSISAINRLTNSTKDNINMLSGTILKDFALTNKILRIVNSAFYRQAGGGNISTVSRAVIVLGFDAIRNIAITVLLFEHLQDKANARDLKEGFLRANLAGLLGREMAIKSTVRDAEESFICCLFHSLGELLAQYYFADEVDAIRKLVQQKHGSAESASAQVLGISFAELGSGIARNWGFPAAIVNSMRKLSDGVVRKPNGHDEMLRIVASFAHEMCDAIAASAPGDHHRATKAVTERFAVAMPLSDKQVQVVLNKAFDELGQIAATLHVNLKQSPFARQVKAWAGRSTMPDENVADAGSGSLGDTILEATAVAGSVGNGLEDGAADRQDAEDAKEVAQSVLAAGIQDISNSLVEDVSLNDILRIVLETMYRAMGFHHVILCLRDAKTNSMLGRFGFGPNAGELAKQLHFSLVFAPNVFSLASAKAVDILITDIDDPKILERIPQWYRERVSAKTFVLFPLVIKGKPVAMIYCDRDEVGSIVIPEKELSMLKTLRNQALLAIKQSS
jgi:serine/threonine protein kinase